MVEGWRYKYQAFWFAPQMIQMAAELPIRLSFGGSVWFSFIT